VNVVATRVGDTCVAGSVGDILDVVHGQGVEVRSDRHQRTGGADVAVQPGTRGEAMRSQSLNGKALHDSVGGQRLVETQLGLGMQAPAEGDEFGLVVGDPLVHPLDRRRR